MVADWQGRSSAVIELNLKDQCRLLQFKFEIPSPG
jgi:hypothetical protein